MKKKNGNKIINSFNCAIEGIVDTIKTGNHMKIHIAIAIIVLIFSIITDASKYEIMVVMISIMMVLVTELLNTGIEAVVDIASPKYHKLAKKSKDAAAGAVLITSINAVCMGYLIFYDKIIKFVFSGNTFMKISGRMGNVAVLILALVSIVTISIKALYKKGTALEGGMPSGHAAISFSILAMLMFMTKDLRIIILSLIMALLVSQSRIKAGIHTFNEVLVGGLIGFSITYAILELLFMFGTLYN